VERVVRKAQVEDGIPFFDLVDEMIDEVAHQLGKLDSAQLSPLAVRQVRLSANLRPEFAQTLQARLIARIVQGTEIDVSICAECTSLRSRAEEGRWLVSLGAVRQEDLRRLGDTLGLKAFMDVGFSYDDRLQEIWMDVTAFRPSDGAVLWTDAYRSSASQAALLRTGRRVPSRAERAAELEQKLAARPSYGYAVGVGMMRIGYDGPDGAIYGGQVTLRFHERFGEQQSNLFGLSAGVFTNGPSGEGKTGLSSILVGAYYSRNLSEPNLNRPEVWFYGEGGGLFSGNEGNSFYLESGADIHLKWRLSLVAGVNYVMPTTFAMYDLGGPGLRLRVAMNW
jgi:hypothetical protein